MPKYEIFMVAIRVPSTAELERCGAADAGIRSTSQSAGFVLASWETHRFLPGKGADNTFPIATILSYCTVSINSTLVFGSTTM